ncbi:DUF6882 domain-containing protein [Methylopila sp. M107]|uniref:DUF6882 domain-containing protein n=1 Tax=Methylopila sp. M107 TaxID=1101190 RepID=UPI0003626E4B|nr:DUF6882 domain-containing protein [Methylopila sp. M107]
MASFLKRLFGGGGDGGADEPDHATVMARARNELELKTGIADRMFGIGSAAWSVDLQEGAITFDAADGRRAVAPVQVIGTLDTKAGTWMWGWDHPSVPEPCGRDAAAVRDYGAKRGLAEFATKVIPCDEAKAWEFTSLAAHLANAQGGYRGPSGTTLVFMTFGTVTLSKPGASADKPAREENDLGAGLDPVDAPDVLALVQGYGAEIAAIERRHYALSKEERRDAFEAAIAEQQPVYERYWRRDDDYWRPCSVSSRSENDPALNADWRTLARGPGRYRVTYRHELTPDLRVQRAYDVERFPDGLRIVDHLF